MPAGADHRATTLYSVGPKGLTMMQSGAAAKIRGGGPILETGVNTMGLLGDRHLGSSTLRQIDHTAAQFYVAIAMPDGLGHTWPHP